MLNLNQLLDTGYWSSLIASPWTALLHLIDISIVVYLIYNFSKAIAGTKIMTLIRGFSLHYCPDYSEFIRSADDCLAD